MTLPIHPADRQPKGDHNRRLSMGLSPEQLAEAAGVSVAELRAYESTGPDQAFDVDVAELVGDALKRLEKLIPNSEPAGVTLSLDERSRDDMLAADVAEHDIRETAYRLWEADGRPEGRDQHYWYEALAAMRTGIPTTPADADPIENRGGRQMDDNIDDLGRRPDGSMQEQPGISRPSERSIPR